jgi:hypothetical protein
MSYAPPSPVHGPDIGTAIHDTAETGINLDEMFVVLFAVVLIALLLLAYGARRRRGV